MPTNNQPKQSAQSAAYKMELSESDTKLEDADYDFDVAAEDVAKSRNQIVVYPKPNQLQLDLDTEDAFSEFQRRFGTMDFSDTPPTVDIKESASGEGHRHVTLTFNKIFEEWERLAIQAALGDDPIRVFLNVKRKIHGIENPSRLFEKDKA